MWLDAGVLPDEPDEPDALLRLASALFLAMGIIALLVIGHLLLRWAGCTHSAFIYTAEYKQ